MIFERLGGAGKSQLDTVAALIERLPWHDEEEFIGRTLYQQITLFSRFNDMDVMAILLASLKKYHRSFVIALMDQLLEDVIRACEKNDFKDSQRRIAMIKFVGECYNFKVVHTATLFDLLYRLININWPGNYHHGKHRGTEEVEGVAEGEGQ